MDVPFNADWSQSLRNAIGAIDDPLNSSAPPPPFTGDLNDATKLLQLTPQEQFLYQHHLDNLNGTGKVVNPDGSISTVLQAVIGQDGKYYNIPTVWNGKILTPQQAAQEAAKVGIGKFPSYPSSEAADERYMKMHPYFDKDVSAYTKNKK